MKSRLLDLLACPDCHGDLVLDVDTREGDEITRGTLRCGVCARSFPVTDGVPRFVDADLDEAQRATATNFGTQWHVFDEVAAHHEPQFQDWIAPVTPAFVRGRTVLEAGCGKGRHTDAIARWGASDVVGVDFSKAVDVAYRHTHNLPNAHVVQADIHRLPFRDCFDWAFSVGVLHHLPDPRAGFMRLVRHVRPGGAVSVWVYGRENNGWIVHVVNPLRRRVTSRLGERPLYWLSWLTGGALYAALRGIYRPLTGTRFARLLPYGAYLTYITPFPFREIHSIVFDHLAAPIAFYVTRAEVESWFRDAGIEPEITWHNQNSWRGFGRLREST